MNLAGLVHAVPRNCSSVFVVLGHAREWALNGVRPAWLPAVTLAPSGFFLVTTRDEVYNILWVLVFGFATLNILSLGARRFEAQKRGLNFGEVLAILIVIISIVLLGWEMLYVFHILPIRLSPR